MMSTHKTNTQPEENVGAKVDPKVDPKLWLDNVRAVPIVGIKYQANFESASTILSRIRSVLEKWRGMYDKLEVTFEKETSIKIERSDGLEFHVRPDNIFCKFFYVSSLVEKGHSQPVIKYQIGPQPYSSLSAIVRDALLELTFELAKSGNRPIERVGVVAEGNLDWDRLPPGFELFVSHLSSPWKRLLPEGTTQLVAALSEGKGQRDRCIHTMKWNEKEDGVFGFNLDWQRHFEPAVTLVPARLKDLIGEASQLANEYFGRFGLGDLHYADHE